MLVNVSSILRDRQGLQGLGCGPQLMGLGDAANPTQADLDVANKKVGTNEKQVAKRQGELKAMLAEVASLEGQIVQKEQATVAAKNAALKTQLAKRNDQIATAQAAEAASAAQVKAAATQAAATAKKLADAEAALAAETKKRQAAGAQAGKRTTELTAAQAEVARLQKEADAAKAATQAALDKNATIQKNNAVYRENNTAFREQITNLQKQVVDGQNVRLTFDETQPGTDPFAASVAAETAVAAARSQAAATSDQSNMPLIVGGVAAAGVVLALFVMGKKKGRRR